MLKNKRRVALKLIRDVSVLLFVLYLVSYYQQRNMNHGNALPIQGLSTTGQILDNQQFDSAYLIYFWATWCGVCKMTSPAVSDIAAQSPVIAVAVASGSNTLINQFLATNNYQFSSLNVDSIPGQWRAEYLPAIYIVDKKGQIRFVTTGISSKWGLTLKLWIADTWW